MRVQHNIMAMNAYRNYNNNTKALSGNLEKLSSGYKINRAGDDAAGLAISEKMRAQITGLDAAQKNVKDAISFVKTAEGAMQEVQDMLKRMKYLATQSANGTYQNEVDREALQDEVDALISEIDRIAQSANFNGIYMLNGPSGDGDDSAAGVTAPAAELDTTNAAGVGAVKVEFAAGASDAQKTALSTALAGKSFKVAVDEKGGDATVDTGDFVKVTGLPLPQGYTATFKDETGTEANFTDGTGIEIGTGTGKLKAGEDLVLTIKDDAGKTAATITIGKPTKANAGADTAETTVTFAAAEKNDAAGLADAADAADAAKAPTFTENTGATDKKLADYDLASLDLSGVKGLTAESDVEIEYDGANQTLKVTVGGKTYTGTVANNKGTGNEDIELFTAGDADGTGADGKITVKTVATTTKLGADSVAGDNITKASVGKGAPAADDGDEDGAGTGNYTITMQIGDTAKGYNQLTMNIKSVSSASIGVSGLSIANRKDAADAIQTITDAINDVSSTRGQLGAYQNRLEHTANNLSVMAENITDAESTIRDTDVAEEMMSYVKNNILVQSAQAMLAQANQVPQGVLQLLG